MRGFFILLVVFVLSSCHQQSLKVGIDTSGVPHKSLSSIKLELTPPPLLPKGCYLKDTLLVVFEPEMNDGFLHIYSTKSCDSLSVWGKIGMGNTEFQNPRFLSNQIWAESPTLVIGDYNRICFLDVDSLLYGNKYQGLDKDLSTELPAYNYLLEVSDSLMIFNVTAEGQLLYYNCKNGEKAVRNYYDKLQGFEDVSDFCYTSQIYDAYYSSNKADIVIAYKNFKQIDIVDKMSGSLKKRIQMDRFQDNLTKMNLVDKSNVKMSKDARLYFSYVYPSESSFYALCWENTRENIKKGIACSSIYELDWNGNLKSIYQLDKAISYFCIDHASKKIYAIGMGDDLDIVFFCYSLT